MPFSAGSLLQLTVLSLVFHAHVTMALGGSAVPGISLLPPHQQVIVERVLGASFREYQDSLVSNRLHGSRAKRYLGPSSRVLDPVEYGADPFGVNDSSPAFEALIADMIQMGQHEPVEDAPPVDLGGVVVDLFGGKYSLSRPVTVPRSVVLVVMTPWCQPLFT